MWTRTCTRSELCIRARARVSMNRPADSGNIVRFWKHWHNDATGNRQKKTPRNITMKWNNNKNIATFVLFSHTVIWSWSCICSAFLAMNTRLNSLVTISDLLFRSVCLLGAKVLANGSNVFLLIILPLFTGFKMSTFEYVRNFDLLGSLTGSSFFSL